MILAIFVHKFSRLSAFDTLLFALRANFVALWSFYEE
jgi:hypothetical protein